MRYCLVCNRESKNVVCPYCRIENCDKADLADLISSVSGLLDKFGWKYTISSLVAIVQNEIFGMEKKDNEERVENLFRLYVSLAHALKDTESL